jgi:hypothetical protein
MDNSDFRTDEFVNDIAEDVLGVLRKERFFERLDDLFCPEESGQVRARCGHSFANSTAILCEAGMDSDDIDDVLAVLRSKGGCCDCEVLYNVAGQSRLKAKHWKTCHAQFNDDDPTINTSIQ